MECIFVVDYGSSRAQQAAKEIRKLGVFSEIVPPPQALNEIVRRRRPRGIVALGQMPETLPGRLEAEGIPLWPPLQQSSFSRAELAGF